MFMGNRQPNNNATPPSSFHDDKHDNNNNNINSDNNNNKRSHHIMMGNDESKPERQQNSSSSSTASAGVVAVEQLQQELNQVESGLEEQQQQQTSMFPSTTAASAGILFESLGSAMTDIRSRIEQQMATVNENVASTFSTSLQGLQDRLSTLERAYSQRIPLRILRQQEEHGQQEQTTNSSRPSTREETSTSERSIVVHRPSAATDSVQVRQAVQAKQHDEDESSSTTSSTGRRRPSTLVASRRYAQAHESNDMALHEATSGAGIGMIPSTSITSSVRRGGIEEGKTAIPEEDCEDCDEEVVPTTTSKVLMPKHVTEEEEDTMSQASSHNAKQLQALLHPQDSSSMDGSSSSQHQPPSQTQSTILYSWGIPNDYFELMAPSDGSNGNDKKSKNSITNYKPQVIPATSRLGRSTIMDMDISETTAAFCTITGSILICGDNQEGAVDPTRRDLATVRLPTRLEQGLSATTRLVQVSCGLDHTAAITEETRSVLTWGNDVDYQLGHYYSLNNQDNPNLRRFRPPAAMVYAKQKHKQASQVACGHRFTIVLTTRMEVYICGREEITGYNHSPTTDEYGIEVPLSRLAGTNPALEGLPITKIAAGNEHAVVLTAHGTAYAWGNNSGGACGREFPKLVVVPVPIQVPPSTMKPQPSHYSLSLQQPPHHQYSHRTSTACTASMQRQPFANWDVWNKTGTPIITLADDVAAMEVACGANHTVLVTKTGRLLVAGGNSNGSSSSNSSSSPCCHVQLVSHPQTHSKFVTARAGTNHTVLLDDLGNVWTMNNDNHSTTANSLSLQSVLVGKSIGKIAAGGNLSLAMVVSKATTKTNAKSSSALPGLTKSRSIIMTHSNNHLEGLLDGIFQEPLVAKRELAAHELARQTEELFKSPAVMNSLFLDPKEIEQVYQQLLFQNKTTEKDDEQSLKYRQQVVSAIEKGMLKGLESIRSSARLLYPESIRCLLLYLQCPLFRQEDDECSSSSSNILFDRRGDLILSLCETILGLPFEGYKALLAWATFVYSQELFVPYLVKPLVTQLNKRLQSDMTRSVPVIVGVLKWFQNAAERSEFVLLAKPQDFYSHAVGKLPMEALFDDLMRFKRASKHERASNFFFCSNAFLMSPDSKRNLLQVENQMTMVHAAQSQGVQFDPIRREFHFQPYFVLAIDRPFLLQQTLQAVAGASPGQLRKSLKIVFKGEDGVDAGGVTKEFFQLLSAQLFDINTGMWSLRLGGGVSGGDTTTTMTTWFNSDCTWNQDGYYLVGVLVGLAVYNSVILDVHFPQAVYRKLLGLPLGLEDMVDDQVRKGLQDLLDYDGDDVEDLFCLCFEVTWNDLGVERKRELKPNGSSVLVTSDTREEYVLLYVKWLLVDSVKSQYDEFERGFMRVMEGSSLDLLLRPEELELLVVGTPELDFAALQATTEYEGGYNKDSPVVQNLWSFVKQASRETQLQFLKFCTGSTKAPIGGLGAMPFKVQRAGPDSMQLPTAHTCFNTLLIPDYGNNYEKLVERLGRAVMECEGFGLQ